MLMLPRNGLEPIVFQYFFELVYILLYIAQPFYRFIVEEIYIGIFFDAASEKGWTYCVANRP